MDSKVLTVAILGVGNRGAEAYGMILNSDPRFRIVALCDTREFRLSDYGEKFQVAKENRFVSEDEFFQKKRADILLIATQDKDHVRHCLRALSLGYDCMLEKPVTPNREECYQLLEESKKANRKVLVCHVLRYAPAYVKVTELLDSGAIGDLMDIHAIEQVGYRHQAHSYVRGNWRNTKESSPMIMAKCCHDLDLLKFFAKSKAKTISSVGKLSFFTKENQPEGAADRCTECPFEKTCPYSAYNIYLKRWKEAGSPKRKWPMYVIAPDGDLTEEKIVKAYTEGPYGRCVFASDNNAVDHEETNILFENGVTANLLMTAFAYNGGRIYKFFGTYGDLTLDEEEEKITLRQFGKGVTVIPFSEIAGMGGTHGGGDHGLIGALYDMMTGKSDLRTSLEDSLESHLMAIAAEESRLEDGTVKLVHEP